MRTLALVFALLVAAGAAAAQGPDPGFESAADYAAWYAQDQAGQASNNVLGYAAEKAEDPEAEAAHAAWMACWAADDAGAGRESEAVCASFYTPALEAAPEQPVEEVVPVASAQQVVLDTVTDAEDAIAEIQEDPTKAPSVVERFVGATLARLLDAAGLSLSLGAATAAGLGALLGLGAAGWAAVGSAAGALGLTVASGIGNLLTVGVMGVGGYADASGGLLAAAGGLMGSLLAAGASGVAGWAQGSLQTGAAFLQLVGTGMASSLDVYASVGGGIADGASAAGDAGQSGLSLVGAAIAGAAKAAGQAIADGAQAMLEAAQNLFGSIGDTFVPEPVEVDVPVSVDVGLELPELL